MPPTTHTTVDSLIPVDGTPEDLQHAIAGLPGSPVRAGGHIIGVVLAAVPTRGGIRVTARINPAVIAPPQTQGAVIDAAVVPAFATAERPYRRRLTRVEPQADPGYPWVADRPIGGCCYFADREIVDWEEPVDDTTTEDEP